MVWTDFDKVTALESHREALLREIARTRQLIMTIGKTIKHLKGTKTMSDKEMFAGFDLKNNINTSNNCSIDSAQT
ncbi:MAG: HTH-type transcriptional activator mta [Verrucomicrobia subdivision 3 bacterium]|nr:HTH-type transcriptional activator mta [Limisphaerales bacterium]MCS1413489.1 HTH-type transcriptional activator mta [Limisphaerales bacterium]